MVRLLLVSWKREFSVSGEALVLAVAGLGRVIRNP
jgi:hypothetical protein